MSASAHVNHILAENVWWWHRKYAPAVNNGDKPFNLILERRPTMPTLNCPQCGTAKTKLGPRSGVTDRLRSALIIYPYRCQLCANRFTTFLGKLKTNPRRNYDRVTVEYPALVRPIHDPSQRIVVEGTLSKLSLRGCCVRISQRIPMGSHVMRKFHPAEYDDPIMIDGAILRSRCAEGIGLRFSSFLQSEERRLRRILDLRLPDLEI